MKAHKLSNLSVREYLQQERESNIKYEYHDSRINPLAGETINHGLINGNAYAELGIEL